MYDLLRKDTPFKITQIHKDAMFEINESLAKAANLSLRLPLADQQLILMCDASHHAAGYVLLTEDYVMVNDQQKKTFAPVAFGSKRFGPGQTSLQMYSKEFLAM